MKRGRPGPSAAIEDAWRIIPQPLHRHLGCDFFVDADPVFAGLHTYTRTDGYTYQEVAHCVYEFHQEHLPRSQRAVTVVLPRHAGPSTVVHELGHVLHEVVGFSYHPRAVSEYAKKDQYESFAESFVAMFFYGSEEPEPQFKAIINQLMYP